MGGTKGGAAGYVRRAGWRAIAAGALIALAASPVAAFDGLVSWTPVQGVNGYRVYVRQNGQAYNSGVDVGLLLPDAGGVVRYTDRGLANGVINFFAVTAYDASGRESGFSNELSLLVAASPAATPSATTTASRTATAAAAATRTATLGAASTATAGAATTPTPRPSNTAAATVTRTVTAAATPTSGGNATIWGPTAVPVSITIADPSAVELGLRFTSDVNGAILGIRFYKGPTNTGTHTGTLWSGSGQRLATATFTGETASGWQQVTLASPISITANTVYVASYHTDVGYYSGDTSYFAGAGVDRPPLHALRDGVSGGNGAYIYGPSAFPANTHQASNYWVDVVFSAAVQPVTPTATTAAVATATSTTVRTATPISTTARTSTPTAGTVRTATPTSSPTPSATWIPTPAGTATIWGATAAPANASQADPSAVELGIKFTSDVNGVIRGIRFYKGATNTGVHTGTLWSSGGQRLATATFTGETASGWQQVTFVTPVTIAANTVYVASYHTDVGYYAGDLTYFATAGMDQPPLHALRDGASGGNGVYMYGPSAFPANSYQAANYWVDVVFSGTP